MVSISAVSQQTKAAMTHGIAGWAPAINFRAAAKIPGIASSSLINSLARSSAIRLLDEILAIGVDQNLVRGIRGLAGEDFLFHHGVISVTDMACIISVDYTESGFTVMVFSRKLLTGYLYGAKSTVNDAVRASLHRFEDNLTGTTIKAPIQENPFMQPIEQEALKSIGKPPGQRLQERCPL